MPAVLGFSQKSGLPTCWVNFIPVMTQPGPILSSNSAFESLLFKLELVLNWFYARIISSIPSKYIFTLAPQLPQLLAGVGTPEDHHPKEPLGLTPVVL